MKQYEFWVGLNGGCYCKQTYSVEAHNKQEAIDKALEEICEKLYQALPDLDIDVEVVPVG